jgi:uncharacterized membrane protein YozB (DUF420 family)
MKKLPLVSLLLSLILPTLILIFIFLPTSTKNLVISHFIVIGLLSSLFAIILGVFSIKKGPLTKSEKWMVFIGIAIGIIFLLLLLNFLWENFNKRLN